VTNQNANPRCRQRACLQTGQFIQTLASIPSIRVFILAGILFRYVYGVDARPACDGGARRSSGLKVGAAEMPAVFTGKLAAGLPAVAQRRRMWFSGRMRASQV